MTLEKIIGQSKEIKQKKKGSKNLATQAANRIQIL